MVKVKPTSSQGRITVRSNNDTTIFGIKDNLSEYYAKLAEKWANSPEMVNGIDYSSRYYANKAKDSENGAKNYANIAEAVYNNIQDSANGVIADIETARVDAVDNITTVKSESIASVEAKGNEVLSTVNTAITEINSTKTSAVNAVNTSKTEALDAINKTGIDSCLNKTQISNCLLEVPQNIKLEFNKGTLTLKAGSKVIVPNGVGVFEELILDSDRTISGTSGTNQKFIFVHASTGALIIGDTIAKTGSGSTDSFAGQIWHVWYDTTNNKIFRYTSNGSTPAYQMSFPIALVTAVDGVVTSIDQVFNGFGYIGGAFWCDKGVKGLIPNGRNEDGSLKNTEFTNSTFRVTTVSKYTNSNMPIQINSSHTGWSDWLYIQEEKPNDNYSHWYQPSTNILYYAAATVGDYQKVDHLIYGFIDRTSGVITAWRTKLPFRAVDYNEAVVKSDLSEVKVVVETYKNGTSWYRVWSDGWCEQGFRVAGQAQATTTAYNLLKPMANTDYTALYTENAGNIGCHQTKLYITSTTQVSVRTPSGGANDAGVVVVMGYLP